MASKKLAAYVHVNDEVYGPDDDVPADVAKQITNPKAWGEEPDANGEAKAPAKKSAASSKK